MMIQRFQDLLDIKNSCLRYDASIEIQESQSSGGISQVSARCNATLECSHPQKRKRKNELSKTAAWKQTTSAQTAPCNRGNRKLFRCVMGKCYDTSAPGTGSRRRYRISSASSAVSPSPPITKQCSPCETGFSPKSDAMPNHQPSEAQCDNGPSGQTTEGLCYQEWQPQPASTSHQCFPDSSTAAVCDLEDNPGSSSIHVPDSIRDCHHGFDAAYQNRCRIKQKASLVDTTQLLFGPKMEIESPVFAKESDKRDVAWFERQSGDMAKSHAKSITSLSADSELLVDIASVTTNSLNSDIDLSDNPNSVVHARSPGHTRSPPNKMPEELSGCGMHSRLGALIHSRETVENASYELQRHSRDNVSPCCSLINAATWPVFDPDLVPHLIGEMSHSGQPSTNVELSQFSENSVFSIKDDDLEDIGLSSGGPHDTMELLPYFGVEGKLSKNSLLPSPTIATQIMSVARHKPVASVSAAVLAEESQARVKRGESFTKGGLAERLSRLVHEQEGSLTLWKHHVLSSTQPLHQPYMDLTIAALNVEGPLTFLSGTEQFDAGDCHLDAVNVTDISPQQPGEPTVTVILDKVTAASLSSKNPLREGDKIRIFKPVDCVKIPQSFGEELNIIICPHQVLRLSA